MVLGLSHPQAIQKITHHRIADTIEMHIHIILFLKIRKGLLNPQ